MAAGSGSGVSGSLGGNLLALMATVTWGAYTVAIVPLLRLYSVWRVSAGALVLGSTLLSEELTWLQVVGGIAIGAALLLARRRPDLEPAT